jgi:hypothetical protein
MAISDFGFDLAQGQTNRVERSAASLNFNTAYTALAHVYIETDENGYTTFFAFAGPFDRTTTDVDVVGTTGDGTTIRYFGEIDSSDFQDLSAAVSLAPGTWNRVAVRRNSASSLEVIVNGSAVITATLDVSARTAASNVFLGNYYSYPMNGRLAGFRVWQAALSNAEIAAEFNSPAYVRSADLWCALPASGDTLAALLLDQSGNGRNFSNVDGDNAIGMISLASGPEYPWPIKSPAIRPYLLPLVR